jgi:hypothetical protein
VPPSGIVPGAVLCHPGGIVEAPVAFDDFTRI